MWYQKRPTLKNSMASFYDISQSKKEVSPSAGVKEDLLMVCVCVCVCVYRVKICFDIPYPMHSTTQTLSPFRWRHHPLKEEDDRTNVDIRSAESEFFFKFLILWRRADEATRSTLFDKLLPYHRHHNVQFSMDNNNNKKWWFSRGKNLIFPSGGLYIISAII